MYPMQRAVAIGDYVAHALSKIIILYGTICMGQAICMGQLQLAGSQAACLQSSDCNDWQCANLKLGCHGDLALSGRGLLLQGSIQEREVSSS